MYQFKFRSMEAVAFCPAHVTGFFKAELDENQVIPEKFGSQWVLDFQSKKELPLK